MTLTRRPSPLGELLSFRSAMDRLFDDTVFRPITGTGERAQAMPLDIYSTPDALVVEAALPGVRPEDVEISVLGTSLTLTASYAGASATDSDRYHVREVRRGKTSRTVTLPQGLRTDAASATFEHGMLRLSMPRAEQARPLQIPITAPVEGAPAPQVEPSIDSPGATETGDPPAGG